MNNELEIKLSDGEMEKIRDILINNEGSRHYGFQRENGEYLDLVEYKDYDKLQSNWNSLREWLEEQHQFIIEIPAYTKEISIEHKTMEICYENVLDKMNELEGGNKDEQ